MGADDEQHPSLGGRDSSQGTDLQLSGHDFDARWNGVEYFHQDKQKNEIIKSFLTQHREEIAMFYESHRDSEERSDFIKSFFNSEPYEMTLSNGVKAGFEAYSDAIRLWRDDGTEMREAWEKWFQIERSVFGMILIEEWTEPQALLLPGVDKQLEFIGDKVKDAPLHLPQGAIDYVLGAGSHFSEGKMRIYRHFSESLSKEENIKFLKNEYGTGGGTDAIPGTGYWNSNDAKGIEISDHYSVPVRRVLFKWNYVEKRISELIKLDRYLSPKEKEKYPQWLAGKILKEAEWKRENDIRTFINEAPEEAEQPKEYRYEYKLGDNVYIGADEYSIVSLEEPVILSDSKFPLFTKEFSKADFDKKVKENPANDHLRIEIETERPISAEQPEAEVDESNKPDFILQYEQTKKENPDGVLLTHIGPFYFAFGKDAEILGKHTGYVATKKNFYGNVFIPYLQVLDFNLSYCEKKLNENGVGLVVATLDKGVIDRYPAPSEDILSIPDELDADYTDAFFINKENGSFDWLYYNPDGNDGNGQFVINHFYLADVFEAADAHKEADGFFDYLGTVARQELADNGTEDFRKALEQFHGNPDLTDLTSETMISILSAAQEMDKPVLTFVQPETVETKVLYNVLSALRIEDIELSYEDGTLVAKDEDNTWKGRDFYRFLTDEVFVYDKDGGVLGLDEKLLGSFKEYADIYNISLKSNNLTTLYRSYLKIKEEHPDTVVLYQVGDFFEAYNDDAKKIAEALDLMLTSRPIGNDERAPLVGLPKHALETYINLLNDRGFDVTVSSLENGERKTVTIVSQNKETPVDSKPIGRIDYLGAGGKVRESIEYTSEYKFIKDIKEENYNGVPMEIYVYADKDGKTISTDFQSSLDPLPQGFKVIPSPYLERAEEEKTEELTDADLIGKEVIIDGDKYIIEKIDPVFGDVSMRDTSSFYPINRVEKINFVREHLAEPIKSYTTEKVEEISGEKSGLPYDVVIQTIKTEEADLTPAWEKKEEPKPKLLKPDVPESQKHNFVITDDNLGVGGLKAKFRANMDAINLLHNLEFENRLATPEEQEILSKYVGFGGLADAFDESKENWADEYKELIVTLSPEEYEAARESTLTAFYTPPVVIRSMYEALTNMGFKTGNILEPSCGVGNFMGMLPETMKDSKFYGVELDSITGRIAQQLYQKANIAVQGYEKTDLPDSFFDIAIGNVPFGQFGVSDRKYNKHNWLIYDYFFGKTLDKVRPGGVITFITSSGTLDKRNSNVRKYIAQRADFLGAIRLPNNTFKANAGTEVTSDIIFLQKRDTFVTEEPDWVHLDRDENGNEYNKYFVDHPEMVLGEMVMESSQFGQTLTCKPYEDRELSDLLSEAVQNIHAEITEVEIQEAGEAVDNSIPADPNVRNFSFTVVDGQVYYRENSRMNAVEVSATAENRIKGMVEIRDSVRELIQLQTEDYPDLAIQSAQDKLNEVYDRFTKKYGLINSRANRLVFSDDSSYYLLCSLEVIGENGELKRKADMFTKRTIKPHIKVTSVETASEALAVSIGDKARVDMPYMCSLSGRTEQELFEELKGAIFLNPLHTHERDGQDKYLTADEYLSGNVREKLALAKRSAKLYPEDYNINVEYLEKVQPKDLDASEISVRLGATWLPTDDVQDFIFETLRTPRYCQYNMKVNFSPITGEWAIKGKSHDRMNVMAENTYGTPRINAYKIIEDTLNLKDVRIFDYVEDEYGNRKPVLNKKETAIAQGKQEMIKQAFQDWIWKDPERRERLCRMYNDTFNSMRAREYDGSHITFSGMNPEIKLREHQVNAVARIMYGGNSLLAHVVGAGKTFTMVAAAQESKRLGLCNKSLIVVPNHLTEQWATEYLQLYPSANILVATKKDFETKNRKKFCARIATGDYDAVIIGHSQFEKIPISIERQKYMLEQQIDEITLGIEQAKYDKGERFTIKQLEKTRKSLEVKLDKLNDQSRKDDVINFEELGIDRLFVDEAHSFKNLFLYTKMRNVGGIAQTEAQKSSDLYMKCRYLDEVTGNKGVVFATGTPVSNSMVELYTMQRYLQYDALSDKRLQHFDSWASTFGETVTAIELAPEGTGYRAKTRFAKFYNLPELMMMFKQVADIQTADMLNLPVPKANYHNIAVKPTDIQKEIVASLGERAEKVRNKMVDSSQDNMLLITNDGRKLALDQRLTNEMLPDEPDSKVSVCADNVFDIWEKTAEQKSTQLIFCDLSTPHNDGKFNVYDDIKKKLIAKGVPENEIAFIHNADTEAKKKELFSKVREGQIRVLIGSTAKMGAGTNVQKKLIAIHHTDCPWRPADLQQREGRIIRQGNENPEVEIYSYVTEETFDAYLYQLVENKQKFIGQIMTSKSPVRSAEDVDEQALSYAEIKALATGNPYIKEKMDLDIEVSKLKLLYQSHLSQRYALEDKLIKKFPTDIKTYEILIEGYENDIQLAKDNTFPVEDGISTMVIEGVAHNDKKAAGSAILELCHAMTSPEKKYIGTYRGFNMYLSFNSFEKEYNVTLEGALQHSISVGGDIQGNITRLDNLISRLPDRLEACKEKLAETEKQIENAKAEIERPFPKEQELKEKSERLAELNALLDMDHKDNEIDEGEVSSNEPERKERNIAR
ncbi:MAG: DEAD/DEAH box helicase family protein [Clostridia bacterium]|nr:DEAD/DEAH box helicase family protein [Clostridia bacterium]